MKTVVCSLALLVVIASGVLVAGYFYSLRLPMS